MLSIGILCKQQKIIERQAVKSMRGGGASQAGLGPPRIPLFCVELTGLSRIGRWLMSTRRKTGQRSHERKSDHHFERTTLNAGHNLAASRLPVRGFKFFLWQCCDVAASIFERLDQGAAWQFDRRDEFSALGHEV